MVLVLRGVVEAIHATFWTAIVVLMCIYVSAIFCTDYLGRAEGLNTLYPGYSESEEEIAEQEFMQNYNPYTCFGSMSRSMLTLFNIALLAEWTEVVRPISLRQPQFVFFFLFFTLLVSCGIMNVVIAMIVDKVISNARAAEKESEEAERNDKVKVLEQLQQF